MMRLIRIDLQVLNANALAGYFTNGISLAAMWGFLKGLEFKIREYGGESLVFTKFGIVQGAVVDKTNEHIKQSMDRQAKANQKFSPPMDGSRFFDFNLSIVAQVDSELSDEKITEVINNAVNMSRVQGGIVANYLDSTEGCIILAKFDENDIFSDSLNNDSLKKILWLSFKSKYSLNVLYLKTTLVEYPDITQYEEQIAQNLISRNIIFSCVGYTKVPLTDISKKYFDQNLKEVVLTEPAFYPIEGCAIYTLNKKTMETDLSDIVSRFFWEPVKVEASTEQVQFLLS